MNGFLVFFVILLLMFLVLRRNYQIEELESNNEFLKSEKSKLSEEFSYQLEIAQYDLVALECIKDIVDNWHVNDDINQVVIIIDLALKTKEDFKRARINDTNDEFFDKMSKTL